MRTSTGVLITLIVCATVGVLAVVGAIVVLVINGRDTAALLSLVSVLISAVSAKAALEARGAAREAKDNTNGTQTKLVDAMVARDGRTS